MFFSLRNHTQHSSERNIGRQSDSGARGVATVKALVAPAARRQFGRPRARDRLHAKGIVGSADAVAMLIRA